MEHKKTKIVLDADVIIHFMEANYFSILPDIFPEYEYLIWYIMKFPKIPVQKIL